ncbi:MAG: ammonium transporter [Bryobacteraceae bacterium]
MTPASVLCLLLILLVPLAAAGLALINTGLGRSRSAAQAMLASLCVMAVAVIVFALCGFAWEGFAAGAAHTVRLAGRDWNWIAAEPFFLRGRPLDGSPASLSLLLQMMSVALAALIPLGSGTDRWRLGASCASAALLAGWTYPLFAHWVWGGGWLAGLGVNDGVGHGFLDAGGASCIQSVGGLTALSIALILGPRRGKYTIDGPPAAIPGHDAVAVLFGCFLALLGWLGLNGAGAMLFAAAEPGRVVLVAVNTMLSAAGAVLAAVAVTTVRFGRPDSSLCANGWVGGLVAGSAACAFVAPPAAAAIGVVAGVLVTFTVAYIEWPLSIDDPCGAISVHAAGGLWGVLAVGVFARFPDNVEGQWLAQFVGVATLLGFVLPMTYSLNWLLNRFYSQRVAPEGERHGMDLHELGAGAYPEFVTHTEEITQF